MCAMPLNETQALFSRAMLGPPDAVKMPAADLAALFATAPEILPERLEIYRNNVVGNLTDAMLATYPLVKILTGEDFATVMMRSCVLQNPPREACLANYGGALPDFIEKFAPAAGLPYLADVARLEWAINGAYHAPDDAALSSAEIEALPENGLAEMNLRLRKSARLVASRWPLESIRSFCLSYDEKTSGELNLEGEGCRFLVFRPELTVAVIKLAADEYAFLEALSRGKILGTALDATLRNFPAFDFGAVLQRHLPLETFAGSTGGKSLS
jgi:hypothetical protein